jgi:hypothetical protein
VQREAITQDVRYGRLASDAGKRFDARDGVGNQRMNNSRDIPEQNERSSIEQAVMQHAESLEGGLKRYSEAVDSLFVWLGWAFYWICEWLAWLAAIAVFGGSTFLTLIRIGDLIQISSAVAGPISMLLGLLMSIIIALRMRGRSVIGIWLGSAIGLGYAVGWCATVYGLKTTSADAITTSIIFDAGLIMLWWYRPSI